MGTIAFPHGGGGGVGLLLHLLLRLAVWHVAFRAMRGFLSEYTHMPWVGTLVVVIIVVALIRFALHRRTRR